MMNNPTEKDKNDEIAKNYTMGTDLGRMIIMQDAMGVECTSDYMTDPMAGPVAAAQKPETINISTLIMIEGPPEGWVHPDNVEDQNEEGEDIYYTWQIED